MALKKTYQASTLPEVLAALAITSFCTTLAVMICLNLQGSSLPFLRMKANSLAQKYLEQSLAEKDYTDHVYQEGELTVKKTGNRSGSLYDCVTIRVEVYNHKQKKLSEICYTTHAD